ncbi:MAG: hypothetical protein JWN02_861 [Acidobacteria bacterium]|nr:hypothetical protein [Acidobacteriota bacterium]
MKKLLFLAVLILIPLFAQAAPNAVISGSVWYASPSQANGVGAEVWVCTTPSPCYGIAPASTTVASNGSFQLRAIPEFNGYFYLYLYRPTPASVPPGAPTGTWGSQTVYYQRFSACSTYINNQNQCVSDINYSDPQQLTSRGGTIYPAPLPPGAVNPFDGQTDFWIHDTGLTWSSGRDNVFRSAGQYQMSYDVYRAAEGASFTQVASSIPCSSSYNVNCSWTQPTTAALAQLTTYHWYVVAKMATPGGVLTTSSPLFSYTTRLSIRRPSSPP